MSIFQNKMEEYMSIESILRLLKIFFREEVIQFWIHGVLQAYNLTGNKKMKYIGKINKL